MPKVQIKMKPIGTECAPALWEGSSTNFRDVCGVSLDKVMKKLTVLTDCHDTIP